jgi:hypothetical protein
MATGLLIRSASGIVVVSPKCLPRRFAEVLLFGEDIPEPDLGGYFELEGSGRFFLFRNFFEPVQVPVLVQHGNLAQ